jgi:hypothetical protein
MVITNKNNMMVVEVGVKIKYLTMVFSRHRVISDIVSK